MYDWCISCQGPLLQNLILLNSENFCTVYRTFTVVHYTEHLSGTAIYFSMFSSNEFVLYLYCKCLSLFIFCFWNSEHSFSVYNSRVFFLWKLPYPKKRKKKIWTFNSWKLFFLSLGLRWCYDRKALITRAERLQPKPMAIFQFHVISKWIFFLLPPHPSISVHLFWVWSKVYLN